MNYIKILIIGILPYFTIKPPFYLIDSIATHSFISIDYAKICPLEAEELSYKLTIVRLARVSITCNTILHGSLIIIEGRAMLAKSIYFI